MTEPGLVKFEHYPKFLAEREFEEGQKKKYRVTTINWTYATEYGRHDYNKFHKNVYVFTLKQLIEWIRDTVDVAEDIIEIKEF
jgi:hypothetical protein